jgi:hypothetical protein
LSEWITECKKVIRGYVLEINADDVSYQRAYSPYTWHMACPLSYNACLACIWKRTTLYKNVSVITGEWQNPVQYIVFTKQNIFRKLIHLSGTFCCVMDRNIYMWQLWVVFQKGVFPKHHLFHFYLYIILRYI